MTLEELFEHGADFARRVFKDSGEVVPMWIGEGKNGQKVPVVAPMGDKDKLVAELKKIFTQFEVVQYVSILESWSIAPSLVKGKSRGEALNEAYRFGSLSEHPDREELIWIHAEDRDGAEIVGFMKIERDDDGDGTLAPLERLPAGQSEGRFTNLLGGNRTTVQ